MKILGIDPGSTRVGYGLIEAGNPPKPLKFGILEITAKGDGKLSELGDRFKKLVTDLNPDAIAMEKLFFQTNRKTGIEVAESRGVMKLIALQTGKLFFEYGPREVKLAVTNDGLADKKSVTKMVCRLLGLQSIAGPDDAADALAVAITAGSRYKIDRLMDNQMPLDL